jgi:hypothetical protein
VEGAIVNAKAVGRGSGAADSPGSVMRNGRLMTTLEVAAFLSIPVATVRQWRYMGVGPRAFKVGRHLRYDPDEVARWLVEDCGRDDRSA